MALRCVCVARARWALRAGARRHACVLARVRALAASAPRSLRPKPWGVRALTLTRAFCALQAAPRGEGAHQGGRGAGQGGEGREEEGQVRARLQAAQAHASAKTPLLRMALSLTNARNPSRAHPTPGLTRATRRRRRRRRAARRTRRLTRTRAAPTTTTAAVPMQAAAAAPAATRPAARRRRTTMTSPGPPTPPPQPPQRAPSSRHASHTLCFSFSVSLFFLLLLAWRACASHMMMNQDDESDAPGGPFIRRAYNNKSDKRGICLMSTTHTHTRTHSAHPTHTQHGCTHAHARIHARMR